MSDQWTIERLPYRAEHGIKDVLRLHVPGGWLMVVSFVNGSANTTFVPERGAAHEGVMLQPINEQG